MLRPRPTPFSLLVTNGSNRLSRTGAAMPGPHVEIGVRDSGCGLSQERLNALFASLLVRGKPRQGGMGLAVVYGIVRAHRGGLCLKPVPPPGTHVCVCLPVAPPLG